jgi:hypothetical protein
VIVGDGDGAAVGASVIVGDDDGAAVVGALVGGMPSQMKPYFSVGEFGEHRETRCRSGQCDCS